jgi:DNA-binding winged helix-turn-helix (wHTH) protein
VLHRGDRWVDLPPLEARLIEVMLEGFGQGVRTEDLLAGGWGGARPGPGALRVHILRLRRRIAPLGLVIHTLPGRGYLLALAASAPG